MRSGAVFAIAAALVMTALSPAPSDAAGAPTLVRATVEQFDHGTLRVKTEMGQAATVTVTPKTKISGVAARTLADIKPDDFIGVTALQGKDGTLHATEVHIFPAAMRGAGEGHHPFDRGPSSSMTNAAVSGMIKSADGEVFTLSYSDRATGKTGQVKIDIAPTVPIVALVPGDDSLLKPGAKALVFGPRNAAGGYTAFAIIAEKDGVKPPM